MSEPAPLDLHQPAEALRRASTFAGSIALDRQNFWELQKLSPDKHATVFTEIQHYFDAAGDELGYIAFPRTPHEIVVTFDPPRPWSAAFKAALRSIPITFLHVT